MKLFTCVCGQVLYFENVRCERCERRLGYLPGLEILSPLEPEDGAWKALAARGRRYRFCGNEAFGVCNWMVPLREDDALCAACRHNRTIPDLSVPENLPRWFRLEQAKRRLIYTLLKLRLPLVNRAQDPERGLAFDFLAEAPAHEAQIMIGHDNGLVTLTLREADDAERERTRTAMGERYRTLLGHFRHEIGHYYWDVLVNGATLDAFRATFGDERRDYASALNDYYACGAPPDWQMHFVTAYASAHPWEDFAETWAHYLHIVDTLETGRAFGVHLKSRTVRRLGNGRGLRVAPGQESSIEDLIAAWLPLAFALNSLNRSMGQADLYPFVLSREAIAKLGFVHGIVTAARTTQAD
ncbi:MAG: putative zinc-binding metallopeptidase [Gammaproteobacteria bacterium]